MTTIGWIGTGNMASAIIRGCHVGGIFTEFSGKDGFSRPEAHFGSCGSEGQRHLIFSGQAV